MVVAIVVPTTLPLTQHGPETEELDPLQNVPNPHEYVVVGVDVIVPQPPAGVQVLAESTHPTVAPVHALVEVIAPHPPDGVQVSVESEQETFDPLHGKDVLDVLCE